MNTGTIDDSAHGESSSEQDIAVPRSIAAAARSASLRLQVKLSKDGGKDYLLPILTRTCFGLFWASWARK